MWRVLCYNSPMFSNPLFQQLTRDRRWPESVPLLIVITLIFSILMIILAGSEQNLLYIVIEAAINVTQQAANQRNIFSGRIYEFLITADPWIVAPTRILIFIIPIVAALYTPVLVTQHARSEAFQLLKTTALSEKDIVRGYIGAVLYKLRLPVTLMLGLCAELLFWSIFGGFVLAIANRSLGFLVLMMLGPTGTIHLLARMGVAVALGAALSLRLKKYPALSAAITLAVLIVLMLTEAGVQVVIGSMVVRAPFGIEGIRILLGLVWSMIMVGIIIWSMRWGQHSLREDTT